MRYQKLFPSYCLPIGLWIVLSTSWTFAQKERSETDSPRSIPVTRPEMKRLIEDVKRRRPRIPLPELTEQQRAEFGDREPGYEALVKYHYLGQTPRERSGRRRSSRRTANSLENLDYGFKVELFWIVSRTNNCQYCIGHQETKLLAAGRSEDRIAALDSKWSMFAPHEKTAFEFARKYTHQPHRLTEADIEQLQAHFTDMQIIEMLLSMSWNNAINRWKEAVGVPQNPDEGGYSRMARDSSVSLDPSLPVGSYLTATSPQFSTVPSRVAPIDLDKAGSAVRVEPRFSRSPLEDRDVVIHALRTCEQRQARLPLVAAEKALERLEVDVEHAPAALNWLRLMANVPEEGQRRAHMFIEAEALPELDRLLKAQLLWIVARQDRAWYATAHAWQQLKSLEQSNDQIFALDGDWNAFPEHRRAVFLLAKNLASSPVVLTEGQVLRSVDMAGPAETVQAIQWVSQLTAFTRITEAAGLPFEGSLGL